MVKWRIWPPPLYVSYRFAPSISRCFFLLQRIHSFKRTLMMFKIYDAQKLIISLGCFQRAVAVAGGGVKCQSVVMPPQLPHLSAVSLFDTFVTQKFFGPSQLTFRTRTDHCYVWVDTYMIKRLLFQRKIQCVWESSLVLSSYIVCLDVWFALFQKENIFTIPNLLCVIRIGLTPYVGYLVVSGQFPLACGVFAFAGFTDLVSSHMLRATAH